MRFLLSPMIALFFVTTPVSAATISISTAPFDDGLTVFDKRETFGSSAIGEINTIPPAAFAGFELGTSDGDATQASFAGGNCDSVCMRWSVGETLTLSGFNNGTQALSFLLGRNPSTFGATITINAIGGSGATSTTFQSQTSFPAGSGTAQNDNPTIRVGDTLGLVSVSILYTGVTSNLSDTQIAFGIGDWQIDDVRTTSDGALVPPSPIPLPPSIAMFLLAIGGFGLLRQGRHVVHR